MKNVQISFQVWFQNRRAKFRRNERSSALNRGSSSSREMEASLPLRPIRVNHHENATNNINNQLNQMADSLQSATYASSYSDYWRTTQQHYQPVPNSSSASSCFVNSATGLVANVYHHQDILHNSDPTNSPINALRLRSHPYNTAYSAMHASM